MPLEDLSDDGQAECLMLSASYDEDELSIVDVDEGVTVAFRLTPQGISTASDSIYCVLEIRLYSGYPSAVPARVSMGATRGLRSDKEMLAALTATALRCMADGELAVSQIVSDGVRHLSESRADSACLVCLAGLDASKPVLAAVCGHALHPDCLHAWFQSLAEQERMSVENKQIQQQALQACVAMERARDDAAAALARGCAIVSAANNEVDAAKIALDAVLAAAKPALGPNNRLPAHVDMAPVDTSRRKGQGRASVPAPSSAPVSSFDPDIPPSAYVVPPSPADIVACKEGVRTAQAAAKTAAAGICGLQARLAATESDLSFYRSGLGARAGVVEPCDVMKLLGVSTGSTAAQVLMGHRQSMEHLGAFAGGGVSLVCPVCREQQPWSYVRDGYIGWLARSVQGIQPGEANGTVGGVGGDCHAAPAVALDPSTAAAASAFRDNWREVWLPHLRAQREAGGICPSALQE